MLYLNPISRDIHGMEYPYDDATLELRVEKTGKGITSTRIVSVKNHVMMTIKLTPTDWTELQTRSGIIAEIICHNMPAGCVGRIHLRGLVADVDDRVFNAIGSAVDVALDGKSAAYVPRPLDYSRKKCIPREKPVVLAPEVPDTTGDAEYAKLLQKMEDNLHADKRSNYYDGRGRDYGRRTTSDIRSDLRKYAKTPGISVDARPESFYDEIVDDTVADDYGWLDRGMFDGSTTAGEIDWRRECELAWPEATLAPNVKSAYTSRSTTTSTTSKSSSTTSLSASSSDCAFGYRSLSRTDNTRSHNSKSRRRTENLKWLLPALEDDWLLELPGIPELITTYYHLDITAALKTVGMAMKLYHHQIPTLRYGSSAVSDYIRELIVIDLGNSMKSEIDDIVECVAEKLTTLPVSGWN